MWNLRNKKWTQTRTKSMHIHGCTQTHTRTHACTLTQTHLQKYTRTHIHTNTHTPFQNGGSLAGKPQGVIDRCIAKPSTHRSGAKPPSSGSASAVLLGNTAKAQTPAWLQALSPGYQAAPRPRLKTPETIWWPAKNAPHSRPAKLLKKTEIGVISQQPRQTVRPSEQFNEVQHRHFVRDFSGYSDNPELCLVPRGSQPSRLGTSPGVLWMSFLNSTNILPNWHYSSHALVWEIDSFHWTVFLLCV